MLIKALATVFKNKAYALLAGAVALIVFAFAVWLPNLHLIFRLATDPAVPASDKLTFPLRLLESITTNFTAISALYTIVSALLVGLNTALVVYYIRRQKQQLSQSGIATSTIGVVSSVFGMGCAACGSVILTSVLGAVGGIGLIAILPLRGGEFGILGVVLLSVSLYLTAKQIQNSAVCKINP